ncbi:hypothetical protein MHY87_08370 [Microvirga sp. ACRRW]|uniref:hypothetical protein n=1 Tax=Microvirga sp. ACRRW TaxID=2918205 RepID=UPI001EF491DC|nr:hypothetical protein [Microvirga sp. ACRRW]MCG7392915.1 hypothetical protein [Microvirga sp. ACRRW]
MRFAVVFFLSTLVGVPLAVAEPFDASPQKYAGTVNTALQQVGTDLRVRPISCTDAARCRFAARRVQVEAISPAGRSGTERITLAVTFHQGGESAAKQLMRDALLVLGATMVAYDPTMPADRRRDFLLELGDAALTVGEAHRDSANVHYALSFDDVSGRLEIIAATLRASHS